MAFAVFPPDVPPDVSLLLPPTEPAAAETPVEPPAADAADTAPAPPAPDTPDVIFFDVVLFSFCAVPVIVPDSDTVCEPETCEFDICEGFEP